LIDKKETGDQEIKNLIETKASILLEAEFNIKEMHNNLRSHPTKNQCHIRTFPENEDLSESRNEKDQS
jgi:hypothetical protein